MNTLHDLLASPGALRIGWTLLNTLWQGALVAALLALAFGMLQGARASLRYGAACLAMLLLVLLPVVTFLSIRPAGSEHAARRVELLSNAPSPPMLSGHGSNVRPGSAEPASPAVNDRLALRRLLDEPVHKSLPWITLLWVAGVAFFSLRLVGGYALMRRITYRAQSKVPADWQASAARIAGAMGVRRALRLAQSAAIQAPLVVGWLRPVILLPARALTGLTKDQIEAILAHELAHIARHDAVANFAQTVIETLLFHHPATWWVSRRMSEEREICCDEAALRICGDAVGYARALARLEELRAGQPRAALAASGGALQERIRRLVLPERARNGGASRWLAGTVALVIMLALTAGPHLLSAADPRTWGEYNAEILRAIASGDDLRAVDLLGRRARAGYERSDPEVVGAIHDLLNRRYKRAFTPPANVDSLYRNEWATFSASFAFSYGANSCSDGLGFSAYPLGFKSGPAYLKVQGYTQPHVVVDFDLDGTPDLSFDGENASAREGLILVNDRSPDGTQAQWLLASAGDPRRRSRVMLYKDHRFVAVLVDTDGDGQGNSGRSGILPPEGTPAPVPGEPASGQWAPPIQPPRVPSNEEVSRMLEGSDELFAVHARRIQEAIAAGRGSEARDLIADSFHYDLSTFMGRHPEKVLALYAYWTAFEHRRYDEVFRPPVRYAEFFPAWTGETWQGYGLTDAAFGGVHGNDAGEQYDDSLLVITYKPPRVTVDLNRDHLPDFVYDGGEPVLSKDVRMVADRAPDGRRAQWLVSESGTDPRVDAKIWLIRDGNCTVVLVRTPDGRLACGKSWSWESRM